MHQPLRLVHVSPVSATPFSVQLSLVWLKIIQDSCNNTYPKKWDNSVDKRKQRCFTWENYMEIIEWPLVKQYSRHWKKKRVKLCQLVSTYTNGFMSFTFQPISSHPLPSFRTRLVFVQKPIKTWRVNRASSNNSKGRFFFGTKRGRLFEGGD